MRPIDGHSGDAESQDDENDDWRIFHDQGFQLWRDAGSHERSRRRGMKRSPLAPKQTTQCIDESHRCWTGRLKPGARGHASLRPISLQNAKGMFERSEPPRDCVTFPDAPLPHGRRELDSSTNCNRPELNVAQNTLGTAPRICRSHL